MKDPARLIEVAAVFGKYGNLTFGGGSATIAVLQEQIELKRRWIDTDQFRLAYGLSRLTPGTNLLAFCTAAGWMTRRWPGAFVALLAASVPCSVIAVLVTVLYDMWSPSTWMRTALQGALAAAVGIIFYTCWHLTRTNLHPSNWPRIAVVLIVALFLNMVLAVSPLRVLLVAAVIGAVWPEGRRK